MTDEEIIFRATGVYPQFNKRILSLFRDDTKPNCYFELYKGFIRWMDYTCYEQNNMSAFDIVCMTTWKCRYSKNMYREVKEIIDGWESNASSESQMIVRPKPPQVTYEPYIDYQSKPYTKFDAFWWKAYGIDPDQLSEDLVSSVGFYEYMTKNGKRVTSMPRDLCFVYDMWGGEKKLYMPNAKELRFLGTTKADKYYEVSNEPESKTNLFMLGSYKDTKVVNNSGWAGKGLQSESVIPPWTFLSALSYKVESLCFLYDLDATGIKNAIRMVKLCQYKIGLKNVFVTQLPEWIKKKEAKDPAGVRKMFGESACQEALQEAYETKFVPEI